MPASQLVNQYGIATGYLSRVKFSNQQKINNQIKVDNHKNKYITHTSDSGCDSFACYRRTHNHGFNR